MKNTCICTVKRHREKFKISSVSKFLLIIPHSELIKHPARPCEELLLQKSQELLLRRSSKHLPK